jgi:hypothetical protein
MSYISYHIPYHIIYQIVYHTIYIISYNAIYHIIYHIISYSIVSYHMSYVTCHITYHISHNNFFGSVASYQNRALLVMIHLNQHFRDIWDIHGIKICLCVYYFEKFSNNGSGIHCFRRNLTLRSEYKDRGSVSLVIKRNSPCAEEVNSSVQNFLCSRAYGPQYTVCLDIDIKEQTAPACMLPEVTLLTALYLSRESSLNRTTRCSP